MDAFVPDNPWFTFLFVVAIGLFGAWIHRRTRREVAGYTPREVEKALDDLLSSGSLHDWEVFLYSPIDDPYLESIRVRCQEIEEIHNAESDEGKRRVRQLLDELRQAERQRRTFNA
jgi:hypothetical protein